MIGRDYALAREQMLNEVADKIGEWVGDEKSRAYVKRSGEVLFTIDSILSPSFSFQEWQERRAIRIRAGLIEIDNPVTSSATNSQAKEIELDMLASGGTCAHKTEAEFLVNAAAFIFLASGYDGKSDSNNPVEKWMHDFNKWAAWRS